MSTPSAKAAWQPTIPVDQSIYEASTTKKCPIGTRLVVGDRTFFYARVGTAVTIGQVLVSASPIASHNGAILTMGSTAIGAKVITVTMGTLMTANQYAEGYMFITNSTGANIGQVYKVKSHPAVATAASASYTLYDGVVGNITATDKCGFMYNLYDKLGVSAAATGTLEIPVGVATVSCTTNDYIWVQTWGPGAPRNVAATAAGVCVGAGSTGGVVNIFNGGTTAPVAVVYPIGKNYNLAGTAADCTPIYLTIRP